MCCVHTLKTVYTHVQMPTYHSSGFRVAYVNVELFSVQPRLTLDYRKTQGTDLSMSATV